MLPAAIKLYVSLHVSLGLDFSEKTSQKQKSLRWLHDKQFYHYHINIILTNFSIHFVNYMQFSFWFQWL